MLRHLFILLIVVIPGIGVSAQETVDLSAMPSMRMELVKATDMRSTNIDFNYKKTKEWKTYTALRAVGWSALGVGVSTFFAGCIVGAAVTETGPNSKAPDILLVTGAALTVVSVPVLTVAYCLRHKAKKKARQMSLGVTAIDSKMPFNAVAYTPALSMSFTF